MNLDQLQTQWQQLDERVTRLESAQKHRRRKIVLYASPLGDILFGFLMNCFSGLYLIRQAETLKSAPMAALPMLLILGTGILLMAMGTRQIFLLSGYGLHKSPLENWQALTSVRTLQVKTFCVLMGVWTPCWFLVPIAFLQSLGAHQILSNLNPSWMFANVFVGLGAYASVVWAMRKWLPAATLTEFLTGASLNRAIEETKAVKRFATDLS
jgi:hypothetical protein